MPAFHANEQRARERAREVVEEFDVTEWPLFPEVIAEAANLPVEERSDFPRNTYGALFKIGNGFRIAISRACHSEGQRRFTLCHELGHYFLDGHAEVLFDGGIEVHMSDMDHFRGRKHWFEVEADAFAAELLVPSTVAHELIASVGSGIQAVRAIEERFGTSLSCAAVRYAYLTAEPAVVILSHSKGIEWVAWSSAMRSHPWTRARFRGEWAPPRSATYSLMSSPDRVLRGESVDGEGLLVEWFDKAPDVTVTEEAIGLGAYGRVLTVLTCTRLPSPDRLHVDHERERKGDWRDALRPWHWDSYEDAGDDD